MQSIIILSWFLILLIQLQSGSFGHGYCGPLRTPYFGKIHGKCDGDGGDQCFLVCDEHFEIHGHSYKICNSTSSKWEPIGPFSCQDRRFRCEGLRPPLNGNLRRACSNFVGSSCYIGCNSGYVLEGSKRLICMPNTLKWTPEKPTCKALLCPIISVPQNGTLKSGKCKRHVGAHCEFRCLESYYLQGSRFRHCMSSGIWSGEKTDCVKTCPDVSPKTGAVLRSSCSPGISGKYCHVSCIEGYKLNGSRNYTECLENGTWDSTLPQCTSVTCPPLEPPVNGSTSGNCQPGVFGVPCIFRCDYGFRLIGNDSTFCQANGKWSQVAPTCQKITCANVSTNNTVKLSGNCQPGLLGKWCHAECIPGFGTHGKGNVTCLISGHWSAEIPECHQKIHCDAPEVPENGFIEQSCALEIGSECKQICNPEFVPQGTAYRRCLPSGHWDGIVRHCIPKSEFEKDT